MKKTENIAKIKTQATNKNGHIKKITAKILNIIITIKTHENIT